MGRFVACWSYMLFWELHRFKHGEIMGYYDNAIVSDYAAISVLIFNLFFGIFISIPYFLYNYALILILGIICIFSKKPLFGYCGIVDRGIKG